MFNFLNLSSVLATYDWIEFSNKQHLKLEIPMHSTTLTFLTNLLRFHLFLDGEEALLVTSFTTFAYTIKVIWSSGGKRVKGFPLLGYNHNVRVGIVTSPWFFLINNALPCWIIRSTLSCPHRLRPVAYKMHLLLSMSHNCWCCRHPRPAQPVITGARCRVKNRS